MRSFRTRRDEHCSHQRESMSQPPSIKSRSTPWQRVILICGKCSRKLDGGFGSNGRDSLRTALRAELKEQGYGRSVRIIETRCMGVCPKKAVTTIDASHPGRIYVVPKGAAEEDILVELEGPARVSDAPSAIPTGETSTVV
jgi:hypothetical protein